MIVMIVGDQDDINGRKVLKHEAGRHQAFGASEGYGTCSLRPVRIGQHIDSLQLYQERGMPDPCHGGLGMVVPQKPSIILDHRQPGRSGMEGGSPGSRHDECQTVPACRRSEGRIRVLKSPFRPVSGSPGLVGAYFSSTTGLYSQEAQQKQPSRPTRHDRETSPLQAYSLPQSSCRR